VPKDLAITMLLDVYGAALSERQRLFMEDYYNNDLSLGEIAADAGITRQGVRDAIKRGEAAIRALEEQLGLCARFRSLKAGLDDIATQTQLIYEHNLNGALSLEINEATAIIAATVQTVLTKI